MHLDSWRWVQDKFQRGIARWELDLSVWGCEERASPDITFSAIYPIGVIGAAPMGGQGWARRWWLFFPLRLFFLLNSDRVGWKVKSGIRPLGHGIFPTGSLLPPD